MKKHPTWVLAKEFLGIDGGTIHQVAKAVHCSTSLLLAEPDDACEVKIGDTWRRAMFISLDAFPLDADGRRWAKFTAFVPGAFAPGRLTGLKGDHNIRWPVA